MRFDFIKNHRHKYSISQSTKLLEVTRAGYYQNLKAIPSSTELRHQYLTKQIKRVFNQHKGNYGSIRITQQLYNEGIETNKRVVAQLMQKAGLLAKGYYKRFKSHTKKPSIEQLVKDNLLNREFDNKVVDQIWVTDITYISCSDGRLYLSTYIDLATRIPRCFKTASSMKKDIVIDPLKNYNGKLPDVVHSDRGSQYTSHEYTQLLQDNSIIHSMSKPGTPVDNAVIESFHNSIKRELIKPNKHKTKAQIKVLIDEYLMHYYIYERIHTKFMKTPYEYQQSL